MFETFIVKWNSLYKLPAHSLSSFYIQCTKILKKKQKTIISQYKFNHIAIQSK